MNSENQEWAEAVNTALAITKENAKRYVHDFPSSAAVNGFYEAGENTEWTTGFCTGMFWLGWELSGDSIFRETALLHVDSFLERIQKRRDVDHHDMGFLYSPSCVAAFRLTGSEKGKTAGLMAAENLAGRFHALGGFIQAWGRLGESAEYRMIIDCLLNLPLLYWASDITKDNKYRKIAEAHTRSSVQYLVREDHSTFHTIYFSSKSGFPVCGSTAQGYKNDSAWARGQAWGIYGMALAYKYTGDERCLRTFKKVTDFFLSHLPEDEVPYWDLIFKDGDSEPKDSSSAAIAACGMLEMAGLLPPEEKDFYTQKAQSIVRSLYKNYAVNAIQDSNGLLLHGVYAKSSPYNTVRDRGVDECNLWGDYFYLEALTRLTTDWKSYW